MKGVVYQGNKQKGQSRLSQGFWWGLNSGFGVLFICSIFFLSSFDGLTNNFC